MMSSVKESVVSLCSTCRTSNPGQYSHTLSPLERNVRSCLCRHVHFRPLFFPSFSFSLMTQRDVRFKKKKTHTSVRLVWRNSAQQQVLLTRVNSAV